MSISEFVISNYIFVLINIVLILIILFLFILISILNDKKKIEKYKKKYDIDISWKNTNWKVNNLWPDIKININKTIDKSVWNIKKLPNNNNEELTNNISLKKEYEAEINSVITSVNNDNSIVNVIKNKNVDKNEVSKILEDNNFSSDEIKKLLELKKTPKENLSNYELNRINQLDKIIGNDFNSNEILDSVRNNELKIEEKQKKIKGITKTISDNNLSDDDIQRLIHLKEKWEKNLTEMDKEKMKILDVTIDSTGLEMYDLKTLINDNKKNNKKEKEKLNKIWKDLNDINLSNDEVLRLLELKNSWTDDLSLDDKNKLEILDKVILDNNMSVEKFSKSIKAKVKSDKWIESKSSKVNDFVSNNILSIDKINRLLDLKASWYTKFSQDELQKLSEIEYFFNMNFLNQDSLNEILDESNIVDSPIDNNYDTDIYRFLEKLWVSWKELLRLFELIGKKNIAIHPFDRKKIDMINDFLFQHNELDPEWLVKLIQKKYPSYLEQSNVILDNYLKNNAKIDTVLQSKVINKKNLEVKKYKTF